MGVGMFLCTLVAIAWLYFLWSRRRYYMCALKMGGPMGWPLLGIIYRVYKPNVLFYALPRIAKEYNQKTYFTWFGMVPAIYTIDPSVTDIVLNSPDCLNKPSTYNSIKKAFGTGVFSVRTPKWHRHRKLLNPSFGYKIIVDTVPLFNHFARDLCAQIGDHVGRGEFDMHSIAIKTGIKVSLATTMSNDGPQEESLKILKAFETLIGLVVKRMQKPWLDIDIIYSWSSVYKSYTETRAFIMEYLTNLVTSKLDALKSTEPEKAPSFIFVDQAVRLVQQNEFTVQDAICNANVLVVAAYDTTANALFTTLMCLAMNPSIQEKVFDEISANNSHSDSDVTWGDVKNFVYLEMCINEALRLAPSVPLIGRVVEKDLPISKDITVPAGTEAYIDIFNLHRNEDIWGPEPEVFNPDNFLPSNVQSRHKCAFIPFSKGKRNCIGWLQAMTFLKIALVQILRKYKFSTKFRQEDLKYLALVTLRYARLPLLEVERR